MRPGRGRHGTAGGAHFGAGTQCSPPDGEGIWVQDALKPSTDARPSSPVLAQPSSPSPDIISPTCCSRGWEPDGFVVLALPALWLRLSCQEDAGTPGLPPSPGHWPVPLVQVLGCGPRLPPGLGYGTHMCLPPPPRSQAGGPVLTWTQPVHRRASEPGPGRLPLALCGLYRPQAAASPDSSLPSVLAAWAWPRPGPRGAGAGAGATGAAGVPLRQGRQLCAQPWCGSWRDESQANAPLLDGRRLGRGWACPWLPSFLQPKP